MVRGQLLVVALRTKSCIVLSSLRLCHSLWALGGHLVGLFLVATTSPHGHLFQSLAYLLSDPLNTLFYSVTCNKTTVPRLPCHLASSWARPVCVLGEGWAEGGGGLSGRLEGIGKEKSWLPSIAPPSLQLKATTAHSGFQAFVGWTSASGF